MAKKPVTDETRALLKRVREEGSSGELSSTLGRGHVAIRRVKLKGETEKEYQARLDREDQMERERARDPSLGWYGQKLPVRYDE